MPRPLTEVRLYDEGLWAVGLMAKLFNSSSDIAFSFRIAAGRSLGRPKDEHTRSSNTVWSSANGITGSGT